MGVNRPTSHVAGVALSVAIALVATISGLRTGYAKQDVDEAVYRNTLLSMRQGEGYYPAMRDALVLKENRPPRSVRAIRPPTTFLLLRWFPPASWRWIAGLAYVGVLLGAWRLGR